MVLRIPQISPISIPLDQSRAIELQAISSTALQLSQRFNQRADEEAAFDGARLGKEQAKLSALAKENKFDEALLQENTIKGRAFEAAAKQAHRLSSDLMTRQKVAELTADPKNRADPQRLQKALGEYAQGRLQQMPEQFRDEFKARLEVAGRPAVSAALQRQFTIQSKGILDTIKSARDQYVIDAGALGVALAATDDDAPGSAEHVANVVETLIQIQTKVETDITSAAAIGLMAPKSVELAKKATTRAGLEAFILGRFGATDDKESALKEFLSGEISVPIADEETGKPDTPIRDLLSVDTITRMREKMQATIQAERSVIARARDDIEIARKAAMQERTVVMTDPDATEAERTIAFQATITDPAATIQDRELAQRLVSLKPAAFSITSVQAFATAMDDVVLGTYRDAVELSANVDLGLFSGDQLRQLLSEQASTASANHFTKNDQYILAREDVVKAFGILGEQTDSEQPEVRAAAAALSRELMNSTRLFVLGGTEDEPHVIGANATGKIDETLSDGTIRRDPLQWWQAREKALNASTTASNKEIVELKQRNRDLVARRKLSSRIGGEELTEAELSAIKLELSNNRVRLRNIRRGGLLAIASKGGQ